ncbi:uncharacterized protein N7459_003535 [Penicillium hispanicum]|uniref:uncharacterized protein n=1 Tax=Penicillium hispanicum TaxID=1080232 RepID=UPI0025401752|nr:uncharacterized protein N7459_003535 [Penicillium hispanicum]KAJ5587770.1 hypothetical protein N7459_003535 [Penicillium hispanicum]
MEENSQLSAPATGPAPLPTPLKELHNAMKAFFAEGIKKASYKFCALKVAVLDETTVIQAVDMTPLSPFMMPKIRWGTSTVVATLVLILAATADTDLMHEALDFFGWQSLTLPRVSQVTKAESADFAKRFAQAKKAAIDGKVGEMTVLGVHLVDIEKLERLEKGCAPREHCSFMHAFAVAIGREGFRVYQAWGEPAYRIDEYMKRGGSKLRGWDEGKKFVKNFSRLSRNHVCPLCFGIDHDITALM